MSRSRFDQSSWAQAWEERYPAPAPQRKERPSRPRARLHSLAVSAAMLTALVVPLAAIGQASDGDDDVTAAGNARGEAVEIQVRNRSTGETGLVTASNGYSLRLSNTQANGGGGAVYGCRSQSSPPASDRACLYADNLRAGEAFLFRSRQGTTVGHFDLGNPAGTPFTTNATGRVANLNADRLDDLHASEIIAQGRAAETLGGQSLLQTGQAFRSTLAAGAERVIATKGTVSVAHQCVDQGGGTFESRLVARSTQDGAVMDGVDDFSGATTFGPGAGTEDTELLQASSSATTVGNDIDDGWVLSANGNDFLSVDGESTALGVRFAGVDCIAVGHIRSI